MTIPATDPYSWATAPGTREAVSALMETSGWVAGEPVPAGLMNGLLGVASDWLVWQAKRSRVTTFRTGFAVPILALGDIAAATTGVLQTSEPAPPVGRFGVRIYNNGGGAAGGYTAVFPNGLYMDGDTATAVAVDMSASSVSDTEGVLLVSLEDIHGNSVAYTAVPDGTNGEIVLAYDASESTGTGTVSQILDGWVDVYFSFSVSHTDTDFLDIASIAISI